MNLVFLDIDGVLNGHDFDQKAMSTRIQYRCVRQLNRIIDRTDCKFVLSSAWRYMVLKVKRGKSPAMTLKGFEYMMRTHGTAGFRLIDTTPSDEEYGFPLKQDDHRRGRQIRDWLKTNRKQHGITRAVAIDDEDWGISHCGTPLIQTNGKWGLSRRNADAVIAILTGATSGFLHSSDGFGDISANGRTSMAG